MRRWLLLGVLALAVVALVVWRLRGGDGDTATRVLGDGAVGSAPAPSRSPVAAPDRAPATHVRRLEPEQRKQLAAQIAAARERARTARTASHSAGGTPASDDAIALEQVSGTVKTALEEAIPLLAACYGDAKAGHTAAVQMVMYSDPAVGTVIDTDAMTDRDGKPLPAKLDDCLRTTIEALELPPLDVGGRLPLQYSFVFD